MKKSIIVSAFAFMLVLPFSTWQVFRGGVLTVYSGKDASTPVVYSGVASGYNGSATNNNTNFWKQGMALGTSTVEIIN